MKLQEFLYRAIEDNYILEMGASRQDFIKELTNMSQQICHNLLLISYCQLFDSHNTNFNHWVSELWGGIRWAVVTDLKKLEKKRHSLAEDTLKLVCKLDQFDEVYNLSSKKLQKENLRYDQTDIWDKYLENLDNLIEYIGKGIEHARKNPLNTIFQ